MKLVYLSWCYANANVEETNEETNVQPCVWWLNKSIMYAWWENDVADAM